LGGLRSLRPYLQRTAVQGSPDAVSRILGTWQPGASRTADKGHPFTLTFDDLEVGDAITTASRTVTLEDIEAFADLTGDHFYAHMDEEAAAASPIFGGRVAHGYLVVALAAGLFVWPDPGPVLANYGEVAWDSEVVNQDGDVVAAYDVLTMVANRSGVNGAE
jgi:oxepin-CoA hydrolase/3-oxo-5,6-dehydrosuberyl-CoA semialdehyde dehydrogenase